MADVVLSSVRKVYSDGFEAVKGVTLDIADGEFLVLVGPSGCGKSTTLRMIAGLEDVTYGTIAIGGRVVNDVEPKDRDIAMVFQNYALYPHMTVYENMAFALKIRRTPRDEIDRRVRRAASMLEIEGLLSKRPREMSGGQRQRVAVGRAIVREPRCFLFDEPLSNLDAKLRVGTRAELKSLHQRLRTTTVYVTHDQEEAMTLGDRIAVMCGGEVRQCGPPLEVYRSPADRFVASFVGTPPMNFIDGILEPNATGARFLGAAGGASGGSLSLDLGGRTIRGSMPAARRPVVLGIRPSGLSIVPKDQPSAWSVGVRVVEPLGDAADVTCVGSSGERIVARVPSRELPTAGATIGLRADPEAVHVFEPGEFGRAI